MHCFFFSEAAAVAVVAGEALPGVCILGGPESAVNIAAVMGIDPGTAEPLLSYNTCSGGDSATGAALVVDSTGAGLRAARSIHLYMTGESLTPPLNTLFKKNISESIFKSVLGIAPKKRTPIPELPVDEHTKSFVEADLVITKADALYEANRCLLKNL